MVCTGAKSEEQSRLTARKLATQADLGFAYAYINGDVSFVDQNEDLLNFFLKAIEEERYQDASKLSRHSGSNLGSFFKCFGDHQVAGLGACPADHVSFVWSSNGIVAVVHD
ncbi:hypothetical protein Droror1_Dr00012735 [Drosera rotundifolia]